MWAQHENVAPTFELVLLTLMAQLLVYLRTALHGRVAQLVEQRTENPRAEGSSPPPTTIKTKVPSQFYGAALLTIRVAS